MPQLLRKLGARDAALIVMGGVIGSGIFRTPSSVARLVHTGPLVMIAWLAGGLIALVGAGVFAELAARRPKDGGVYAYLRDAYHPVVAFCYGWTLLLISQSGGTAASAVLFSIYLPALTGHPLSDLAQKLVAIAVIALFTIVNCLGVREGTSTQNGFMLLKIAAIAGVIVIGIVAAGMAPHHAAAVLPHDFNPVAAFGLALVPIMFTYSGWQTSSFMSAEMKDPQRALPLGMLYGMLGVAAIYLAVTSVSLFALGDGGLAATKTPVSDVIAVVFGSTGAKIMAAIIMLSTLGFIMNQILTSPRVYHQMAEDKTFFPQISYVSPLTHAPIVAIAVQGAAAIAMAAWGGYEKILDAVTAIDYVFFGFSALAVFLFRRVDAAQKAPEPFFRIPLHPWSTALFGIFAWYIVANLVVNSPGDALVSMTVLASGVLVYWLFVAWSKRTANR